MAKDFSLNGSLPLGLRNNNPGNLRYVPAIKWKGQIGENKGFAVFRNIAYGIRAYGMDLRHDINAGHDTIEKLIYEFAPPSENNTEAYINNVAKISGIPRKQKLLPNIDTLLKLAKGMFTVELGEKYAKSLTNSDIKEGLLMMGGIGGTTAAIGGLTVILLLFIFYILITK